MWKNLHGFSIRVKAVITTYRPQSTCERRRNDDDGRDVGEEIEKIDRIQKVVMRENPRLKQLNGKRNLKTNNGK